MKRLVAALLPFALLSGCAVVPYEPAYTTYGYPVTPYPYPQSVYPAPAPVYAGPPVYAAPVYVGPPVTFGFNFLYRGGHGGHGGHRGGWGHRH